MEYHKGCEYCENDLPFDMPEQIISAIKRNELVIFAGAGISTERKNVFPFSFYDEVANEINVDTQKNNYTFPELMSLYTIKPDGRKKLLELFKQRYDYTKSFSQIYRSVTEFHRELSNLHQITEIITTNWDDYFEEECSALPIVTEEDFAFWNFPGRKVLKIHGSINNIGTIVADTKDYEKCYKRLSTGIIGSDLKMLLATKTIVFCGYSLTDPDFRKIYKILRTEMGDMLPHAYFISLGDIKDNSLKDQLTIIKTDAVFFVHMIKRILTEGKMLYEESLYEFADYMIYKLNEVHRKTSDYFLKNKKPQVAICLSYQDGLYDAYDRAIRKRGTGQYLCPSCMHDQIIAYEKIKKNKKAQRNYLDVAYIEGYQNGLISLVLEDEEKETVPLFYVMGYSKEIYTINSFKRIANNGTYHKSAEKKVAHIIDEMISTNEVVIHHSAFIF